MFIPSLTCFAEVNKACLERLNDGCRVDEVDLNGSYERVEVENSHGTNSRLDVLENGVMEMDAAPPHGSTMGSNGYLLNNLPDMAAAAQHRTSWSPVGTVSAGHPTKIVPLSAALHTGTLATTPKTDTSVLPNLGTMETETNKSGTSLLNSPSPSVIHRARKTMSRLASNQTLKVKKTLALTTLIVQGLLREIASCYFIFFLK